MKLPIFLFFIIFTLHSFAQNSKAESDILSEKEVLKIFNDSLKIKFKINYPIFRVYKYFDKSGIFFTVLTESRDSIGNQHDTANYKIKALTFKIDNGRLLKMWDLNDFINKKDKGEQSIWFWTKYSDFKDFDNDTLIEPIIVYGTFGFNGYEDGQIKIAIFYKGQKILLKHQNGTLDFERQLKVDKSFYSLPNKLQNAIKEKMELMIKNKQAIFPFGWQKAMTNKKMLISESR